MLGLKSNYVSKRGPCCEPVVYCCRNSHPVKSHSDAMLSTPNFIVSGLCDILCQFGLRLRRKHVLGVHLFIFAPKCSMRILFVMQDMQKIMWFVPQPSSDDCAYTQIMCNNSTLNMTSESNLLSMPNKLFWTQTYRLTFIKNSFVHYFTYDNLKGPQKSSGGFQASIKSKMLHLNISNFKYSPNHLSQMSLHSLDLFCRFLKASHARWQVWGLLLTHWPLRGVLMIFRIEF